MSDSWCTIYEMHIDGEKMFERTGTNTNGR